MSKKVLRIIAVLLFQIAASSEGAVSPIQCRGGDGPGPLVDISLQLPQKAMRIDTLGGVNDYLYWKKNNSIVYRNTFDELYEVNIETKVNRFIAETRHPLSRFVDPNEETVYSRRQNLWIDSRTTNPTWEHIEWNGNLEHLFLVKEHILKPNRTLYSLTNRVTRELQTLELSKHFLRPGHKDEFQCHLNVKNHLPFYVGKGHQFPRVLLYNYSAKNSDTYLSLYEMQASNQVFGPSQCSIRKFGQFDGIPGEVTSVVQSPSQKSFIVSSKLRNKETYYVTFLGSNRNRMVCNFGSLQTIVSNSYTGTIAAWNTTEGLVIFKPSTFEYAHVLPSLTSHSSLSEEHIWIDEENEKLFMALENDYGSRKIYLFPLKK